MPSITREQLHKLIKNLPENWHFDTFHYCTWGDKEIYTDSPADNETGVFYRLTLEYKPVYGNSHYCQPTGQQPTASIHRYTPTGTTDGVYYTVHILDIPQGDPQPRKNYNVLVKIAGTIDTGAAFNEARQHDNGRKYNTIGA